MNVPTSLAHPVIDDSFQRIALSSFLWAFGGGEDVADTDTGCLAEPSDSRGRNEQVAISRDSRPSIRYFRAGMSRLPRLDFAWIRTRVDSSFGSSPTASMARRCGSKAPRTVDAVNATVVGALDQCITPTQAPPIRSMWLARGARALRTEASRECRVIRPDVPPADQVPAPWTPSLASVRTRHGDRLGLKGRPRVRQPR